jgi:uncharacterized membrane protein
VTRSDLYRQLAVAGCALVITVVSFAVVLEISARLPYVGFEVWHHLSHQGKAVAVVAYFVAMLVVGSWMRRVKAQTQRLKRSAAHR